MDTDRLIHVVGVYCGYQGFDLIWSTDRGY